MLLLLLSLSAYPSISAFNHFDRAFEDSSEPWDPSEYVHEAVERQNRSRPPTNPPTLDGLLYAEVKHPGEATAIRWMNANIRGTPTIVTAPGGRWEWRSAAASFTGLPTIAGWGHELVYRDWNRYYQRVRDVRAIYFGGPRQRLSLLRKYDVRYVYVGPSERERYEIWPFSRLDGVSVAYRNEAVTLYRVDQRRLHYTPPPSRTRTYAATDLLANTSTTTIQNETVVANGDGRRALAFYGPYEAYEPGTYTASFVVDASGDGRILTVDVASGAVVRATVFQVLARRSVRETDGVRRIAVSFHVNRFTTDLEFRGHLLGNGSARLHSVTVTPKRSDDNSTRHR